MSQDEVMKHTPKVRLIMPGRISDVIKSLEGMQERIESYDEDSDRNTDETMEIEALKDAIICLKALYGMNANAFLGKSGNIYYTGDFVDGGKVPE